MTRGRRLAPLVIGESIVDIVERRGDRDLHVGGSPLNVASGLARLGMPTRFLTRIGDDERGDLLAERLRSDGVELVHGSRVAGPTSTATATIREDGSAHYEFDIMWDLPRDLMPDATLMHFGSISAFLEPGSEVVQSIVRSVAHESVVSFDPNIRPLIAGGVAGVRPAFDALASLCHIIKLSDEDAHYLYGTDDLGAIVREILSLGPRIVAVTLGEQGALVATPSSVEHIESAAVDVVDTIGAGDSFMCGLLVALFADSTDAQESLSLIDAGTLRDAARFATRCAAITVSRAGADLPWRGELDSVLAVPHEKRADT